MLIRDAVLDDLEGIAHVASTSYADAFGQYHKDKTSLDEETKERRSEKYFREVFGNDTILVAVIDDVIVGYLQFGDMSENDAVELRRLFVLTKNHRQGIGEALVEAMFVHPDLGDATTVYLDVWDQNLKAYALYESFGFTDTGRREPIYENGVKIGVDNIMVKHLRTNN